MKDDSENPFEELHKRLAINGIPYSYNKSIELYCYSFCGSIYSDYLRKLSETTHLKLSIINEETINNVEILKSDSHILVVFNSEPSGDDADLIKNLLLREIIVIPIIIFTEDFLNVHKNEKFGYEEIIQNTKQICKNFPTIGFFEDDVIKLKENTICFFETLYHLIYLENIEKNIMKSKKLYEEEKNGLTKYIEENINFFEIYYLENLINELTSILISIEIIKEKEIKKFQKKIRGKINIIQRKQTETVSPTTFQGNKMTWMGQDLLPKKEFNNLSEKINIFLDDINAFSSFDTREYNIDKTKSLLDYATELSVLGTFSSGKTTLINSLLNIKLQSSGVHNTAILTEIKYEDVEIPYVYFKYKSNVDFVIMEPDITDNAITTHSSGQIIDIIDSSDFKIILIKTSSGRIEYRKIGFKTLLSSIKKGKIVKSGELLTEGIHKGTKKTFMNFKSFKKNQIETLIFLLENDSFYKSELKIYEFKTKVKKEIIFKNNRKISKVLREFFAIVPEGKYPILEREDLLTSRFENVFKISFSANIKKNHLLKKKITLNEKGWIEFQGDTNNIVGFAENPECYLFIKKAVLCLNNEFLKLAKVTDTPGLGSITEMHDEITEQYLRDSMGIILLMIKIDAQVERGSLWELLSLLQSVYKDKPKDNIFIFCNWWKNQTKELKTIHGVSEKIKKVEEYLNRYFRDSTKIYLCDLKGLLIDGIEKEKEGLYFSYGKFKRDLSFTIGKLGVKRNLKQIKEIWSHAIQYYRKNLKNDILFYNAKKDEKNIRLKSLKQLKNELKAYKINSQKILLKINKVLKEYKEPISLLQNKKSWIANSEHIIKKALNINNEICDEEILSVFRDSLITIKKKMDKVGIKVSSANFPVAKYGGLPVHSLDNKINKIIDNWPLFALFTRYKKNKRNEIYFWFDTHTEELKRKFDLYFIDCEKWFEEKKIFSLNEVNKRIEELENWSEDILSQKQKDLKQLELEIQPKWVIIEKEISSIINK